MKTTELSGLHQLVAQVLVAQLGEEGERLDGSYGYLATPALIAAATKFLKDNQVTAEVAVDNNLGKLEDILKAKELKGRKVLASVSPIEAAKEA